MNFKKKIIGEENLKYYCQQRAGVKNKQILP